MHARKYQNSSRDDLTDCFHTLEFPMVSRKKRISAYIIIDLPRDIFYNRGPVFFLSFFLSRSCFLFLQQVVYLVHCLPEKRGKR